MKQRNLRLVFFAILILFGACEDQKENKTLKDIHDRFLQNFFQNSHPGNDGPPSSGPGTGSLNFTACAKVLRSSSDVYLAEVDLIPYERCKKEILYGTNPEEYRAIRLEEFKKSLEIVSPLPTECAVTISYLQERIDDPSKIQTPTQAIIDMTRYYPVENLLKEIRNYLLNYTDYNYTPISEETFAGSQIGKYSEFQRLSELKVAAQLQYYEQISETACSQSVMGIAQTEFPEETYFWGSHVDSSRTFLFAYCYYGNYFDVPERENVKCATLSEEF
ncbi:hypothetical protein CH373_04115 [Leptospira perolatii]|uniref:Lipoprotein n=1 Tax=Leptospira perolatii TaxID=2023191 RepID=A0A2M9ZPW1_9LEPT|nr:hypothetical protein [Leptospira perolatii]PJZ69014.1 hypothetical protein CH360_13215 [Leptospira perolatii]PJZ74117.1 hypothetical protein CH373_04115 [Leptospira perolatii]